MHSNHKSSAQDKWWRDLIHFCRAFLIWSSLSRPYFVLYWMFLWFCFRFVLIWFRLGLRLESQRASQLKRVGFIRYANQVMEADVFSMLLFFLLLLLPTLPFLFILLFVPLLLLLLVPLVSVPHSHFHDGYHEEFLSGRLLSKHQRNFIKLKRRSTSSNSSK